jgi:hypothetical protein
MQEISNGLNGKGVIENFGRPVSDHIYEPAVEVTHTVILSRQGAVSAHATRGLA